MAALLGLLLLLLSPSDATAQPGIQPTDPRVGQLEFHTGSVDTKALPNLLQNLPERFSSRTRYVVQLDGPITPEKRARLESIGVELQEYVSHYAYVANLSGVRSNRLRALRFLQWMGVYRSEWKLDREVGARVYQTDSRRELAEDGQVALILTLFRGVPAAEVLEQLDVLSIGPHAVGGISPLAGNVTISLTMPLANVGLLAELEEVQFVEEAPEITLRNSTNRWIVQSNQAGSFPLYDNGIHGENQVIGIMDGRIDVNHCAFSDSNPIGPNHRKLLAYNTAQGSDFHGTHVGGTAAGDGGANDNNRGVAYLSKIVFHDVPSFTETAMYNRLSLHHGQGARLHSNSWGDDGTTNYNSLSRGIDSFSRDFEESLVLFAVTNTGSLKNPENAKNVLAVGASQDTPGQGNFCSGGTGPTADGRRKPEIFAPGCSTNSASAGSSCSTTQLTGTSMACPAVAGTGALVRQYYVDGYYPSGSATPADALTPSGALLKATLLNSSVDMTGISGYPSNQEGWGRVQSDRSLFFPGDLRKLVVFDDIRNAQGLSTGTVQEYNLEVQTSTTKLQVTMAYTDVPAAAGTGGGNAAVNDLDLEVLSPSGDLYLGNVFSGGNSTPGGTKDPRNNVEQVHVPSPQVGSWTVRVRAAAVNQSTQGYALIATGDVVQELPPLRISLPNGAPTTMLPGQGVDVDVTVSAGAEQVVAGSPTLHFRASSGASFQTTQLTSLGGDNYRASVPAVDCGEEPEFYFSAQGDGGTTITNPATAPAGTYTPAVGEVQVLFSDDFETNMGWTVENVDLTSGAWQRAIPNGDGTRGDPTTDADGSGRCYVTQNGAGDTDVDGGPTRLVSPAYDLEGTDAMVSYHRWMSNDDNDDVYDVQISANNGSSWTTMDTVTGGGGGWIAQTHRINDFITPTDQVRFRVRVSDNPNNSVTEAGFDAFKIEQFVCIPAGDNPDLAIGNLQVDYDPSDGDVDAGPGALGQAANVIVTVQNQGNIPVLMADLDLVASVNGGSAIAKNQVVSDFSPAAGTQSLAPGGTADIVFVFAAGELDRCGTYSLEASHNPTNLETQGSSGSIFGDTDSSNDSLADHPDTGNDPDDAFSPDLLELAFGTFAASIQAVSEVIENRATERVRVDLDYSGLGPGGDSHDVRLFVDLVDENGDAAYLGVFTREKMGARSSGNRSLILRLDVSNLFPSPPPGSVYKVRLRLRDLGSAEICITATTDNTTTLQ